MGKINMGFFYGKLYYSRNRTFSLENGENFIEGTGPCLFFSCNKVAPAEAQAGTTSMVINASFWRKNMT